MKTDALDPASQKEKKQMMTAHMPRIGILSQELEEEYDEQEVLIPNEDDLLQLVDDEEPIRTLHDPVGDAEPIDERQPVDQLDGILADEILAEEIREDDIGDAFFREEPPAKKPCCCDKHWGRTLVEMR